MSDLLKWKSAKSPNYETNKDKLYPYSELPYEEEYKLVKIPICVKNLIEHVDYFGRGKIVCSEGTFGFYDCFNVNFEYALITVGADAERKIPNRIPIRDGDYNFTRNYIKDNSVLTVTVSLKYDHGTIAVAKDIARIVNSDFGKVIVYGYNDKEIDIISEELREMKQLFFCPIYVLPENLQLTFCNTRYKAFLSLYFLKKELFSCVKKADYEASIILTGCLNDVYCGDALGDVINKLIENNVENVIDYAHKLWNKNLKEVVCKHFPNVFQKIFNGDCMVIINKKYNQALDIDSKLQAWGINDSSYKAGWKFIPMWKDNCTMFKLYNIDKDIYLDHSGEKGIQARGTKREEACNQMFYLEPRMINEQLTFSISNCEVRQLRLDPDGEDSEDRAVLAHATSNQDADDDSMWILSPLNNSQLKVDNKQSGDDCFDIILYK